MFAPWYPSRLSWLHLQNMDKSNAGCLPRANREPSAHCFWSCLFHSSSLLLWDCIWWLLHSGNKLEYKVYKERMFLSLGSHLSFYAMYAAFVIMVMIRILVTPIRLNTPWGNELHPIYLSISRMLYTFDAHKHLINICRIEWKAFIPFGDFQNLNT